MLFFNPPFGVVINIQDTEGKSEGKLSYKFTVIFFQINKFGHNATSPTTRQILFERKQCRRKAERRNHEHLLFGGGGTRFESSGIFLSISR